MRVFLASAFARETDLLVLDEPGSSLDPLMRDRLCDRFRDYIDSGNGERSIIFSTHNIADMENAADYVIFMDNGKVVEQGFTEDEVKLLQSFLVRVAENLSRETEEKHP